MTGAELKAWREAQGLSLARLAMRLELSPRLLMRYERSKAIPDDVESRIALLDRINRLIDLGLVEATARDDGTIAFHAVEWARYTRAEYAAVLRAIEESGEKGMTEDEVVERVSIPAIRARSIILHLKLGTRMALDDEKDGE